MEDKCDLPTVVLTVRLVLFPLEHVLQDERDVIVTVLDALTVIIQYLRSLVIGAIL